jgi:uncharacterized protein YecE (DUF72 family)
MASLFPNPESDDLAPQAARLAPKLRTLAEKGIYFGTSSWKYPGWVGSVYSEARYETRKKFSKKKFEETCLAEYAATFPTVCGDFAFYRFPPAEFWAKLFDQLPEGFLCGLKVPENISVAKWPGHARYGKVAGQLNEDFLNADLFRQLFLKPLQPYREKLGPLIIEFGTFNKATFPKPADFYQVLDPFLAELPEGYKYGIEIRNSDYLTPEYLELLKTHNVAHVFNAWTRMPGLEDQSQLPDAYSADFTVVRALLKKGRDYEKAVEAFEPYEKTMEVNEGEREGMVRIADTARKKKTPAFLFVNNRLEGNAPSTIEAVVEGLSA